MARRGRFLGPALAVVALVTATALVVSWGVGAGRSASTRVPGATTATALDGDGHVLWGLRTDGTPIRWDPCVPVSWTTRPGDPAWVRTVTADSVATLTATTGLTFRHVESADTGVGPTRSLTGEGGDWAPVLVTLTTPAESQWLTAADRGLALPVTVDGQFVTGQILLRADAPLTRDLASRDGSWGATIMHEWGHMVGLDHVDDPRQLMFPAPQPGPATWAAGDLHGLRALGAETTCLPAPPAVDGPFPAPQRR